MGDPSAQENHAAVEAHLSWWAEIWKMQAQRGLTETWNEPEFGPAPYIQTLPHTQMPVVDLWEANRYMASRISSKFDQTVGHSDFES